jgi:hypothetical protein
MGWIQALLALLGMGGAGYANSQSEGVNQHDLPASGYDPNADPLLSALSMNAMTGIGAYDPTVLMDSLPLQQLYAGVLSTGAMNRRRYQYLQDSGSKAFQEGGIESYREAVRLAGTINPDTIDPEFKPEGRPYTPQEIEALTGFSSRDIKNMERLESLAIGQGYDSLDDLIAAERSGRADIDETGAQVSPVADAMRQGILSSQGRVAQYLQNLPNLLTGEANPFIDQLQQEALHMSQRTGTNPYGALEQARSTALQRALQLVAGEQSVVNTQQAMAQPVLGLRSQNQISAAQIGSAQAQMLAQVLQGNSAMDQQQNQYLASLLLAGGLMGGDALGGGGGTRGPGTQPSNSQNHEAAHGGF